MRRYLLDTSVIVDYLRGKKEVVEKIENLKGELFSSVICLGEIYEGIARAKHKEKVKKKVELFFASLDGVLEIDEQVARTFGELRAKLRRAGKPIGDLDTLIAATCQVHNLILLTKNIRHFERIDGLEVEGL